jgi:hypothetical protein
VTGTVVGGTVVAGAVVDGTVVAGTVVDGTVVAGTVVGGTVVGGTVVARPSRSPTSEGTDSTAEILSMSDGAPWSPSSMMVAAAGVSSASTTVVAPARSRPVRSERLVVMGAPPLREE